MQIMTNACDIKYAKYISSKRGVLKYNPNSVVSINHSHPINPSSDNLNSGINSEFDLNRKHPITKEEKPHIGNDYKADKGTPVYAAADGEVVDLGDKAYQMDGDYGYGNRVWIDHGGAVSTYNHLGESEEDSGIIAKPNQKVKKGELIAYSGNTGIGTGPHLHFETRVPKNPNNIQVWNTPAINPNTQVKQSDSDKPQVLTYKQYVEEYTAQQRLKGIDAIFDIAINKTPKYSEMSELAEDIDRKNKQKVYDDIKNNTNITPPSRCFGYSQEAETLKKEFVDELLDIQGNLKNTVNIINEKLEELSEKALYQLAI